jgi:nicotinamidase-related amidase
MTSALLLIDIQNDYFEGGAMELEGALAASQNAQRVLTHFRNHQQLRLHIQHLAIKAGATFFLPGTDGAHIHPEVQPLVAESILIKHFPNSFRDTLLLDTLRQHGIDHLVILGMMTHMCVDATTRAALDLGFRCTVLQDACATRALEFDGHHIRTPDVHHAFLAALRFCGAEVLSTQAFLASPSANF